MVLEAIVAAHIATAAATTVLFVENNEQAKHISRNQQNIAQVDKKVNKLTSAVTTNQEGLIYLLKGKK